MGASERLTGLAAIPLLATLFYYALPGRWQASLIIQFVPQILAYGCLILWARRNQEIAPRLGLNPRQGAEGARLGLVVGLGLGALNTVIILWVMPSLGGNARRITQSGNFPSWSPDGTELLFTSGPWFGPKLYRVSAAGGEPREIPLTFPGDTPGHLLYPHFSSDGRWIVLSSPTDVFVVRAEGGTTIAIARGQAPLWGVESRSIIYSNGEFGQNQSLWRVPFDVNTGATGTPHPLTQSRGSDRESA